MMSIKGSLGAVCFLLIPALVLAQTAEQCLRKLFDGDEQSILLSQSCKEFYQQRAFKKAWVDEHNINELLFAIRASGADGLAPQDYELSSDTQWRSLELTPFDSALLDIDLTISFLSLAKHLHEGKTNPSKLHPGDWDIKVESLPYYQILQDALASGTVYLALESLKPNNNEYIGLKYKLREFKDLKAQGGLPEVDMGSGIGTYDFDTSIPSLRKRLTLLGLLPTKQSNGTDSSDSSIRKAIIRFQSVHGLRCDGIIGRETQKALNLSVDNYIATILVNLERFRWYQSRLATSSIKVNIPSFQMELSDRDTIELTMKAIVGRPDRKTPVLSSKVTMIILNPTWTVPPTVLNEDVLPAAQANTEYLQKHQLRVFDNEGNEIDPETVPWNTFSPGQFPFTLRSDPGPGNPLGLIKFHFPNSHMVFVHDTNVPRLFNEDIRAFSSGCIRVEFPMALARKLLTGTGIDEKQLRDDIESGETRVHYLRNATPIHLVYFTAFADENGVLHLLRDIYDYDKTVLGALSSH